MSKGLASRAWLILSLWLTAVPLLAETPGTAAPSVADLARLIDEQRRALGEQTRILEQQGKALDEQKRTIEELRKQLDETKRLSLSSHNRLEEIEKAAPAPTVDEAVEARLKRIEASIQRIPDLPSDVVEAGEFPGSVRIPGTDVALKVGGRVRVTAVNTFGALGTEDRFVTSSIPIEGTTEAGKEPRTVLTVVPSRINLDLRTPTGVGAMRAFVEGDFAGDGRVFRLRHAFGQWKDILVGQTWSTFADPEAEPAGIDFEGLNAISLFRQPLVRYTHKLGERYSVAAAIENPSPDITNAAGVSQVPDFVLRARWAPPAGKDVLGMNLFQRDAHVNLALLIRQIRGEPLGQPNTTRSVSGYGVGVSGRLTAPWMADAAQITFSVYAGNGIGRYITDLGSLGGQDAYYDPATDTIQALPAYAWYLGLERRWNPRWRSTFTYGTVIVDNLAVQPGDSLHQTNRWSLNLAWSPILRLDIVGEFLFGNRIDKDSRSGFSSQFQLGSTFRF